MSGYYDNYSDDFDGDGREAQSGGQLRKMLEEALGEIRDLRSELNKTKQAKTVTDLLENKGIDPKVAQLIPEGSDPEKFLSEYGSLFRTVKGETLEESVGEEQEQTPPNNQPDPELQAEQQARQEMDGAGVGTQPFTTPDDPFAKLQSFKSEQEMLAYLSSQTEGRD